MSVAPQSALWPGRVLDACGTGDGGVEPSTFVCTVHIGSEPLWSAIQPRFVRTHVPGATLVAAIDHEIDEHSDFDHMELIEGEHRDKLDELARRVVDRLANTDDDILMFLDGDAFPVRALMPFVARALEAAPLAAICREENDEDYPHPSFCVTTVGFWRTLGGTWQVSPDPAAPTNELGGGRLRDLLRERGTQWRRLLRSNGFNPHPVLFGLYEGLVYHHGAGFRRPVTAFDRRLWRERVPMGMWTPQEDGRLFVDLVAGHNQAMSNMLKRLIARDAEFYRVLEHPQSGRP